ncbi:MAG TPA: hypothetical protein VFP55_07070 [Solirubrobacteraceae bacterium]|nr:hypothetical protein [Solirubrobacteraceae bacterium]
MSNRSPSVKRLSRIAAAAGAILLAISPAASGSTGPLRFNANSQATAQTPAGWDEPSGIAGADGELYVASQNPNASPDMTLSVSNDGVNWHEDTSYYKYLAGRAEGQTGDVTMAADRAGTVFLGHLTGALQADIDYSSDDGKTWQTANDVASIPEPGAASNSPFAVDRPWIASYSPDTNPKHDLVYLEYHDFAASLVYVVTCTMTTGTLQCASPVPVSNTQSGCNTIPGGVAVSPPGSPHPGRVYADWTTADPQTNAASGCNYTQLAPFYQLYVAYSDHPTDPSSWHQVPVYVGPNGASENCPGTAPVSGFSTNTCADMSELFTPISVDAAGNAYITFDDYIDTIDKHYDVYLERSSDGGSTWNGSNTGAGRPIMVSPAGGTHYTPNLVAGAPGHVAVSYFDTGYAAHPYVAGDTCPTTVPPETSCQGKNQPEPPSTAWVFDVAESTNANASEPSFDQVPVSDPGVVVHYGDMCNLGIYCDGSSTGNRSMFENTTVFPDRSGNLVAAWTDQRLDPKAEQDAASSTAQSAQVAYDEVFASRQATGPWLLQGSAGPPPPPAHRLRPCARPSGALSPARLGPLRLGMTRARARRVFRRFSTRGRRFMDFFCLTPGGIRAGYPSPGELRHLSRAERRRAKGRVVLLLTATPYYSLRGIRPGATLASARKTLRLSGPFHVGRNFWYVAAYGRSRAVFKVRHGIIEEIGIADARLTRDRKADRRFFRGFG